MAKPILMAVCLLLTVGGTHSGIAQPVPVPEYQHKIMAVSPNNTLIPLERTTMVQKMLGGTYGFYAMSAVKKGRIYFSADGCCSNAHLTGKSANRYVVSIPRVNPNIENPDYGIELFAFESVKKNERRFHYSDDMGNEGLYSSLKKDKHQDFSIPITFSKQSEGVYIITTQDALPPGEYIFIDFKDPNLRRGASSHVDARDNVYLNGYCFNVQ